MKTPLAAAALIALFATAPTLHATDITFPEKTKPAIALTIPADWKTKTPTATNLVLRSPDSTVSISLLVAGNAAETVKKPYDEFARDAFDAAHIKDIEHKEEAQFAGIKGMSYYGTLTNPAGGQTKIEVIIIHIDDTHFAAVTIGARAGTGPEQMDAVEGILTSAKLIPDKNAAPASSASSSPSATAAASASPSPASSPSPSPRKKPKATAHAPSASPSPSASGH